MKPIARSTPILTFSSSTCARTSSYQPQVCLQTQRSAPCIQQRHASSYRRQRKLLNIAPAPSFGGSSLPTGSSGRSRTAKEPRPTGDHIIFNPPPSAPNVYHTPPKFLPSSDPRKELFKNAPNASQPQTQTHQPERLAALSPTAFPAPLARSLHLSSNLAPGIPHGTNYTHTWPSKLELPPPVRTPYTKTYHLGPEEIEEMRRLRLSDDNKWTRQRLADKFKCTQFFVAVVVQASDERKARVRAEEARRLAQWKQRGGVSLKTRKERQKRKALWMAEA